MELSGERTECPGLVITPGIRLDDVGRLHLEDTFMLVHGSSGWVVASGGPRRLRELSHRLGDFYWDFTDPSYLADPRRADTRAAIIEVLGRWQIEADTNEFDGVVDVNTSADAELASFFDDTLAWFNGQGSACTSGFGPAYAFSTAFLLAVLAGAAPGVAGLAAEYLCTAFADSQEQVAQSQVWRTQRALVGTRNMLPEVTSVLAPLVHAGGEVP